MMPELDLELDRVATGGTSLGLAPDGRVVFVAGGLPGERVRARVVAEHRRRIEAEVMTVAQAAPGRVAAPCPELGRGCGGCDWQHASPTTQAQLRVQIVEDCLRRLAGIPQPPVMAGPVLPPDRYRTTVRAAVSEGRAGLRAGRSHSVVPVDSCLVAHPLVEEVLVEGRFGLASEVTIRAGARTGERLVLVTPSAEGVVVPDDVVVVGADEVAAGRLAVHHEEVRGRTLRISAPSFFQCRPDGAEVLVALVEAALAGVDGPLLDAYCGVGLFGACLDRDRPVVGVESNRWAVADAEVNYGSLVRSAPAAVIRSRMERWRYQPDRHPVEAVVADPARSGLGRDAARRLAATGASVIALVSCDPGALARDTTLLDEFGYGLDGVTTLDLFSHTSHVETVSRFVRS